MKTSKIKLFLIFGLVLSIAILPTCKRKQADEFSPFGPSSLSIILKLSASPNIIAAGANRALTTITASLQKYDSNPISGKTVHFEIRDASGNKLYIGHFEGNTSVASRTTDENGEAKILYHGPLGEELTDTAVVYIYARVAWDGKEFVEDLTPIKCVRDQEQLIIELAATPSALIADTYREVSTIKATVWQTGGKVLAKEPIIFEITDDQGDQLNLGYFEDFQAVTETKTNRNGVARVQYWGPIDQEISADTTVYIKAWLPGQSGAPSTSAPISIIRESKGVSVELFATPNVLVVSDNSPRSIIQAFVKKGVMPLSDRRVVFTITEGGAGTFSNKKDNIVAFTNQEGIASVEYVAPKEDDITADQVVTIQAQVEASGDFVTAQAQIQLVRDAADLTLELTADPGIILVTDESETSCVTAVLKEGINPVAGEKIFFTIPTGSGMFTNNQTTEVAWTDSEGKAVVFYKGPTKDEITQDETVTIKAQAENSTANPVEATVDIELIREGADLSLDVEADPNVLLVTDNRPASTITATFREGGAPVVSRTIIFTLPDELGMFSNNLQTIQATTNAQGRANVTYMGPTAEELTQDQLISIQAQAQTSGAEGFITGTAQIQLIKDTGDLALELEADPNVLKVTSGRPTSTISATFTQGSVPLAGRRILFTLPDGLGYFSNGLLTMEATTNGQGVAQLTYLGPIQGEISADQLITVNAQAQTSSSEGFVTAAVQIQLILEQ